MPTWVADIGGPGSSSSIPASVKVDKQNNIYIAGIFSGTVDFDPSAGVHNLTSNNSSFDTYVAKYTTAGKLIWVVSFGGTGTDQVNSMGLDDNGNPSVMGQYDSPSINLGVTTLINNGDKDAFIVHLDTNGNILWGKDIGGSSTDYGDKVVADHLGNVIGVLQYESTISVGGQTFTSGSGSFNGLIVKYDSNGNLNWAVNISDTQDSQGHYAEVDANNNIVVSGEFSTNDNFNPLGTPHFLNGNGISTFLAKYTPNGILTWVQSLNGTVINNNSNLTINTNGDIYLDGVFSSTLGFNSNSVSISPVGFQDVFLSKFAADGTFQWVKDIGGSGASLYNYGIVASADNSVYISGYFSGTVDFDPSPTSQAFISDHGQRDLMFAKYDVNGNYKWAFSAGNASCNNTLGRNLAIDGNNDVLLVGAFCSTVNFDASKCTNYFLTSQSNIRDSFLAKYTQSTPSAAAQITSFSIAQEVSPAVIDQAKQQITVTVPLGTNVTALTPAVAVSSGVILSPASGTAENFTAPVTYSLSSSCTSLNYSVNVVFTNNSKSVITCAGAANLVTGDIVNPVPTTYLWQLLQNGVWVNAPGVVTNKDYQTSTLVNTTNSNIIDTLRRQISVSGLLSYDSYNNVTLQPSSPITNNSLITPSVATFCANGSPTTILGSMPNGGNGNYTYQWQSSTDNITFADIAGATSISYSPTPISNTTYYRRNVTSGTCTGPSTSNVISITIIPAVTNNVITPPFLSSFCATGTPAAIVGIPPTGGTGSYSYQWQSSSDGITFGDIAGAVSADYTPPTITSTTFYRRNVTSGACLTPLSSNVIGITVIPPVSNNTITVPSINSFCGGGDPATINGSTPSGGSGSYTYQWQMSADNITFTDITGANAINYDPQPINATTYYRREVTSGVCTTASLSNVVTIAVSPAIANNTIAAPAIVSFCATGSPATISGSAPTGGDGTNYTYIWQVSTDNVNFVNIFGANGQSYSPGPINATTYYRRTVTSGFCVVPSTSNTVVFTVLPAIANVLITAPAVTAFCNSGSPSAITASTPTGGNSTYAYQWQSSADNITFTDIAGANTLSYSPPALTATAYYRLEVTSGICTAPAASNVVTITIAPSLSSNLISAPAVMTFCAGGGTPGNITGSVPSGGNGTYSYQWQTSTDNITFTDISGANAIDYSPASISATTFYRRNVTSGSCVAPLQSNVITITVLPAIANISISAPAVSTFCISGTPALITATTPTGGNGTYTYQWQSSTDDVTFTDIAGATGQNYSPGIVKVTTYYRLNVTSGGCNAPLASNEVAITILPALLNNMITAPAINSFCSSGSPASILGSAPTGGSGVYTYQWQSSTDNINFTDISGATTANYSPPVISLTTYYRRAVSSGVCTTPIISNAIALTVLSPVTNNTVSAPALTSFCASGTPATITGTTPIGGSSVYAYQWQSSQDDITFADIAGATGQSYSPVAATATTFYRRNVTSDACTMPSSSNSVKITILPALSGNTITAPSVASFCDNGSPSIISGSAPTGGNGIYSFQWQSSTDNVTFNNISGAVSQNFNPPGIAATTYYRRTVTSGICTAPLVSNVITISVTTSPVAPVPLSAIVSICPGNMATLAVSPQAGLTYDWYDSPSKTNHLFTGTTYVTAPLMTNQTFYVQASNTLCSSTTLTPVQVTMLSTPAAPTLQKSAVEVCMASVVGNNILNPQAGITYTWYSSATGGNPLYSGTDFITPILNATVTYYAEAVNAAGCPSVSRSPVTITVNPLPTITATGTGICPGSSAVVTATSADQNATINWYASATSTTVLFTGSTFTTPGLNTNTTYYAEAANTTTGCTSTNRSAAQVLILGALPAPVVTVKSNIYPSITFEWTPVPGATGYKVSIDGGQTFTDPSAGSDSLTHTVTGLSLHQSVTILVKAKGALPCQLSGTSTAVTSAAISPLGDKIFVPNAFTPNGDSRNDIVYVHSESISSLKFYIYDQWGELLFTSNSQQQGWDGTYKGKKEPVGVYVYYLEAVMNDGVRVNKKGTITLLR